MFVDFRTLGENNRIEVDLCIIGAGAAGITIAREFIGSGIDVCLLESGGLEIDAETQALYEGDNIGLPYYDLSTCRLRYFGGTTNHWNGWCRTLSQIDFEVRPHVPHSGWPIARADLEPFYDRAYEILQIGPYVYDERYWQEHRIRPPAISPDLLHIDFWRFSPPTQFNTVYRPEIEASDNVKVFLYANATNIQANSTASAVDHVEVRSLTGSSGTVIAKNFVLACGGVENPRLLLLSNGVESQGLGNRHSLVGRFFMDHHELEAATLITDTGDQLQEFFGYRTSPESGVLGKPCFSASREVQLESGILNCTATLQFASTVWKRELWSRWHEEDIPKDYWKKVWRAVKNLDDVPTDAYGYFVHGRVPTSSIKRVFFHIVGEPAPNPASRVTLSEDRDALGLNRPRLDWQLTALEKRSMAELLKLIGREFGRLDMGRVKLDDWLMDDASPWPENMRGGSHHMGTTRMADDPKSGVVDASCRIHGIHNLYVAGSSVFPTSGSGVPTLSIVALSLRLAEHLRRQIRV
jgi:choline dehydrogenase-like flavoprotein